MLYRPMWRALSPLNGAYASVIISTCCPRMRNCSRGKWRDETISVVIDIYGLKNVGRFTDVI